MRRACALIGKADLLVVENDADERTVHVQAIAVVFDEDKSRKRFRKKLTHEQVLIARDFRIQNREVGGVGGEFCWQFSVTNFKEPATPRRKSQLLSMS